ncbi:oxidative damage protection protein [Oceanobacter mangrovi]|uniref:oxidative damage protection protein n=1 Tax=Oceanobacter mangrovi TaxID=2862510 RepID=UPI001C8DAA40|nr:oxidative damage protection protein [Oceanobacter mangrovi]
MSRTVVCRKYQQELEGLSQPPFPGPAGEDIFNHVSAQAWQEWTEHQTRLINEKHLNMMDKEARKYLTEQRGKFLSGDDFDKADGYVPEKPEN